ncbi:MAG TPA: DUF6599 family protein [Pyrinomonadaceae bacterium]
MRIPILPKLILAFLALSLCFGVTAAQTSSDQAAPLLPERVGDFRAQGAMRSATLKLEGASPDDFAVVQARGRDYVAASGDKFHVDAFETRSDSAAYSLLRYVSSRSKPSSVGLIEEAGVVGIADADHVRFIKGSTFVEVSRVGGQTQDAQGSIPFVKALAENLRGVAGEIPVLVEHLPRREQVNESTGFAVSLPVLQALAGNRPALDAVSFEGGAEAVTAAYDGAASRLVIVEFTTPQYASDNDARIRQRIEQLRAEGKPTPSDYRRVGNYSVFVFDAPNQSSAAELAGGVKYEKDVRWLGDNPRMLEHAQRAYYDMTGNTILNTLILTGVSILLCLGVGGLFGGAVFLYRRSQADAGTEVYSDAGGMVRLNIDDLTAETDPSRLIGSGDR